MIWPPLSSLSPLSLISPTFGMEEAGSPAGENFTLYAAGTTDFGPSEPHGNWCCPRWSIGHALTRPGFGPKVYGRRMNRNVTFKKGATRNVVTSVSFDSASPGFLPSNSSSSPDLSSNGRRGATPTHTIHQTLRCPSGKSWPPTPVCHDAYQSGPLSQQDQPYPPAEYK
jgi:hypothetical protein